MLFCVKFIFRAIADPSRKQTVLKISGHTCVYAQVSSLLLDSKKYLLPIQNDKEYTTVELKK
jgi:hypothetical protein